MRESAGPESALSPGAGHGRSVVATTEAAIAGLWAPAVLGPFAARLRREVPIGGGQILMMFDVEETLDDMLAEVPVLTAAPLREVAQALYSYLYRLHRSGRVHGLLCPASLVRDPSGAWMVLPPLTDAQRLTAPSFAPAEGRGTAAADVYSAGAVLALLASGREVTSKTALANALGPAATPLLRALDPDPELRPSAAELVEIWSAPTRIERPPTSSSPAWLWGIVGVLVSLIAVLAFTLITRSGDSSPALPQPTTQPATTAPESTTVTGAPLTTASTITASTAIAPTTTQATTAPTTVPSTTTPTVPTTKPSTTAPSTTAPSTTTPTTIAPTTVATSAPTTVATTTTKPFDGEGNGN
jgi:hypothetical protein